MKPMFIKDNDPDILNINFLSKLFEYACHQHLLKLLKNKSEPCLSVKVHIDISIQLKLLYIEYTMIYYTIRSKDIAQF